VAHAYSAVRYKNLMCATYCLRITITEVTLQNLVKILISLNIVAVFVCVYKHLSLYSISCGSDPYLTHRVVCVHSVTLC